MKSLRTLMKDRLSGGACAGLFGWLLVLNLFVAALSCGMTVPVAAGPFLVLCEPGAPLGADGAQDTTHFDHDCPYVIGHDGDALLAAAFAPGADLGPAFERDEPVRFAAAERPASPVDPGRLGLSPAPRGPPVLFR